MTDQAEKDNERLTDKATQDNERLIAFWDKALALSEEDKAETEGVSPEAWKEMAPSEKLFWAAASLGGRKKVLDYGCGSGWAGIVAAKSGCPDITAADPAPGAVESTAFYADLFGVFPEEIPAPSPYRLPRGQLRTRRIPAFFPEPKRHPALCDDASL